MKERNKVFRTIRSLFVSGLFGLFLGGASAQAATIAVTNVNDSGAGSLRAAITYANANPGTRITFAIPGPSTGGPRVIKPSYYLPTITANNTTIAGSTQTSYADSNPFGPDVVIDNSLNEDDNIWAYSLLFNNASYCKVEGLCINNTVGTGIAFFGDYNSVSGCYLGISADGRSVPRIQGRGIYYGVRMTGDFNVIGGNTASSRNIIGGAGSVLNTDGTLSYSGSSAVTINGNDNQVLGNWLGLDASGTAPLENYAGVRCSGARNLIGGSQSGAANFFCNSQMGVDLGIGSGNCDDNKVQGNFFGFDAAGVRSIGTPNFGIFQNGNGHTLIGGSAPGEGNRFSGNRFSAIALFGDEYYQYDYESYAKVQGNTIGLNTRGEASAPNGYGVMSGTSFNTIGGTGSGEGNTFVGCYAGVSIANSGVTQLGDPPVTRTIVTRGNLVRGNRFDSTTAYCIDLKTETAVSSTPNDIGDVDEGPNGLQNFPVITAAQNSGFSTYVSGTLDSLPNKTYTIDFYASKVKNASGYGPAERYLGSVSATTGADGQASLSATYQGLATGEFCTATATDSQGSTSEFSLPVAVVPDPNRAPTVTSVTLSPSTPTTNSVLQASYVAGDPDGDALSVSYAWTRNGSVINGATSSIFDLSIANNGSAGDSIGCSVTVTDPKGLSATNSAFVTIANTRATASLALAPSPIRTNNLVIAVPTITDPDGDTRVTSYTWKKNGVVIAGLTGAALDLSVAGNGDKGDLISATVSLSDGTSRSASPLAIQNSSPLVAVGTSLSLKPIAEDSFTNTGSTIEEILASGSLSLADADVSDGRGLVVWGAAATPVVNRWEYSLDNGLNWATLNNIGARLLAADGKTRLRLIPVANKSGQAQLSFQAWDRSSGIAGSEVALPIARPEGDSSAFSAAIGTMLAGVYMVDDAPVLDGDFSARTINTGTSVPAFTLTLTDIDSNLAGATLTAASSNLTLLSNAGIVVKEIVTGSATMRQFQVTLSPARTGSGQSTLTFTASCGGKSVTRTLLLTVLPPNQAPLLSAPLSAAGFEDKPLALTTLKIADSDAGSGLLTLSFVSTLGTATLSGQSSPVSGTLAQLSAMLSAGLVVTPPSNYHGSGSLKVTLNDNGNSGYGGAKAVSKTIGLNFAAVNDAPIAANDTVVGSEDTPLTISAATLLKNDRSGEAASEVDPLRLDKVIVPTGFLGTLSLDVANQKIAFTPRPNWNGTTNFSYSIKDSGNASATATVTLQIAPVNDLPVVAALSSKAIGGTLIELPLTGTDADGDPLTFALKVKPLNGTASVALVGGKWWLRYTALKSFSGLETFSYIANDGKGYSLPATVQVQVTANHAPQLLGVTPSAGTFSSGQNLVFVQKVKDEDGTAHLDVVSLLISNSATSATGVSSAQIWFDPQENRFTLGTNDGTGTLASVPLGQSLENSQVKVGLNSTDITRGSDGTLTLRWRITFKSNWLGRKSLWSRAADLSGVVVGYTQQGQITLVSPLGAVSSNVGSSEASS